MQEGGILFLGPRRITSSFEGHLARRRVLRYYALVPHAYRCAPWSGGVNGFLVPREQRLRCNVEALKMIKTEGSTPLFFRSESRILPLQTDAMLLKTPINTGTFGQFSHQTGIQIVDCQKVLKDRVREHSPLKQGRPSDLST